MLVKGLFSVVLLAATVLVFAWFAPITYLKIEAFLGFGPVSMPWAISHAQDRITTGAYDHCADPVLFAWYGSFGGGPYVPENFELPASQYFEEIILINSGIIWEHTELALSAMASFNEEMIKQCFGTERD